MHGVIRYFGVSLFLLWQVTACGSDDQTAAGAGGRPPAGGRRGPNQNVHLARQSDPCGDGQRCRLGRRHRGHPFAALQDAVDAIASVGTWDGKMVVHAGRHE